MTVKYAEELYDPDIRIERVRSGWRRLWYLVPRTIVGWASEDLSHGAVWVPVMIGIGAGIYFGLLHEPPFSFGPAVFLLGLVAALVHKMLRIPGLIITFTAFGFCAADLRTSRVQAPILEQELEIRSIEGRLLSIENRANDQRFTVALQAIDGIATVALPARARITWRGAAYDGAPGDIVRLRAGLRPPPPPAAPGTFDFGRYLFFQRIGAVGFAVQTPERVGGNAPSFLDEIAARIEQFRSRLFFRITSSAPGAGGAIVAAVVTGKRDAISAQSEAALRDAGLAHLLAISGLHMGLATGLIFFVVRVTLASIEKIALHNPIKKWAAAAALLSGLAYLFLSGGGWSARRAFMMAAIMFFAILVDRRALSLRNVVIAATIILLTTPEALFHPGFQMSFAAVTALIATYEWLTKRADPFRSFSPVAKLRRYTIGLVVTDVIAALATAPYALYHFNRVALYSLPANVLAMPLMGFLIMPSAVVALLLMPIGLDGWAWQLSAFGMDAVLAIATEVSHWPGAVSLTPQWPLWGMLSLSFGGLCLCLLRSPFRLLGVAGIPLAAFLATQSKPPDIFVASSGLNGALVTSETEQSLAVYSKRRDRFAVSVWLEVIGRDPLETEALVMEKVSQCDHQGCVAKLNQDRRVSFIEDPSALQEDCARADIVVAFFPVSGGDWKACQAVLIDRRSVWRRGAHTVRIGPQGDIEVQSVAAMRGDRPWTGTD